MSATTIASYGSHGQKDVCFGRMLKKSASFVLASFRSSTYPRGYASRSFTRCGLAGRPFEPPARVLCTWPGVCRPSNFCFAEWVFRSLLGSWTLTADLSNEGLQTGVSERLTEQERLCSRVVLRQSPRSQPDYVTRWFLSAGSSVKSGNVWRHSGCERGDLGVGGERPE